MTCDIDTTSAHTDTSEHDDATLRSAIRLACDRVAPVWPLRNFVAVNPFLGFTDQSFETTCATMERVNRTSMLMPRAFFLDALHAGDITHTDIAEALASAPDYWNLPPTTEAFLDEVARPPETQDERPHVVATIAEILDELYAGDKQASRTDFMIAEISRFCAAYFDDGQAVWRAPWRNLPLYPAWRRAMRHDGNPEAFGIKAFRKTIAALPDDPVETIGRIVELLGIPPHAQPDYFYRALFDIRGWAGFVRQSIWHGTPESRLDNALTHLLALRLAWGYTLFVGLDDPALRRAWSEAMDRATRAWPNDDVTLIPGLAHDLVLQSAYERAQQHTHVSALRQDTPEKVHSTADDRPAVQAAFCIDVRSEVFRRALESACPSAETFGFAGFFGLPIEYVPIGRDHGNPQCPVLLSPKYTIRERVGGSHEHDQDTILTRRRLRRRATKAWKSFKLSAVSSFTFVETAGLAFGAKLVGDSLGLSRPALDPDTDGLDRKVVGRVGPEIDPGMLEGRQTGLTADERVEMAQTILKAMSMTGPFARLVLLVGHGSSTVNNPHASGLDCGACGGHTGEANARVAAAILNDPAVRTGLAARGLPIAHDTVFIGALHDTTTDTIRLFDTEALPTAYAQEIAQLLNWLDLAGKRARAERAASLGITDDVDRAVMARSRDWSQVRPEWGLAGNAAFIVAPRALTREIDFAGRAFLHTYDWTRDTDFSVLELIMTAPMIVASWINLQYYGSTVNNQAFGAGNKVLHNVVGNIGVLEGNSGDLKTGLPWQSVHDGRALAHKPLRLNVFIAAPLDAINGVIERNTGVRELVDNHWLHLFGLPEKRRVYRYVGDLAWESVL